MQVEVSRHAAMEAVSQRLEWKGEIDGPNSHPEEQPGLVLLIPLNRSAAVQCEQKVSLDDLERLVASGRNTECELLRHFSEFGM